MAVETTVIDTALKARMRLWAVARREIPTVFGGVPADRRLKKHMVFKDKISSTFLARTHRKCDRFDNVSDRVALLIEISLLMDQLSWVTWLRRGTWRWLFEIHTIFVRAWDVEPIRGFRFDESHIGHSGHRLTHRMIVILFGDLGVAFAAGFATDVRLIASGW